MKQKKPSKEEFHDANNEMEQDEDVSEENLSQSENLSNLNVISWET